jgi:hypothetical protein
LVLRLTRIADSHATEPPAFCLQRHQASDFQQQSCPFSTPPANPKQASFSRFFSDQTRSLDLSRPERHGFALPPRRCTAAVVIRRIAMR